MIKNRPFATRTGVPGALCVLGALALPALGQLRVVNWNVTNYSAGRVSEFQTSLYGVVPAGLALAGKSMSPDVFLGEEYLSAAAVTNFLAILNSAPGSPGDWAAAPFVDGPDTDDAFFYRTTRVQYLGMTVVATGGVSPNHPRNIQRYDIRPLGYSSGAVTIACYPSHMKAQESGIDDDNRRLLEAQRIRDNAQVLPAGWHFIYGGDTNIQTSSDLAYVELVGSQANNAGRFFDPIKTPGSWNNNGTFAIIHTQDPTGSGGMDDRHDQVLLCASLIDGAGLDYIGNSNVPYSTTTWNDANHSYRVWGNDGTSFNVGLTLGGNTMVGATIAQALQASASGGGHLPVYLDLRVPAEIDSETDLSFGTVRRNAPAQATLNVSNAGNIALWTAGGISALNYSLAPSAGFSAPAGSFADNAGGPANQHVVVMDTSTPGVFGGTLTITSDAPDQPTRAVSLSGTVLCGADYNGDGFVNGIDSDSFYNDFEAGSLAADYNGDGFVDGIDSDLFNNDFEMGC